MTTDRDGEEGRYLPRHAGPVGARPEDWHLEVSNAVGDQRVVPHQREPVALRDAGASQTAEALTSALATA